MFSKIVTLKLHKFDLRRFKQYQICWGLCFDNLKSNENQAKN